MTEKILSLSLEENSPWSDFQSIQVSKSVETVYSKRIGREAPKTLLSPLKESRLGISDGPWTFALVIIKEMMPKDFDLNQLLLEAGITINMVPFINKHEDLCSYILIVVISYLDLLSMKLHGSMLIIDFDLLEPSKEDERCHGIWKAKERARHYTLGIALHATRMRWNYGLVEFLRVFLRKAGLELEFERAILTWDIQHSKHETLKQFARNLLFFCLGRCDRYDSSSAVEVQGHDEKDWLQRYLTANLPSEKREDVKQIISLFRGFLELSGGIVNCRQHDFGVDYTTAQNANLCAEYLGFSGARQFGHFDPGEMQRALSKSRLFTEASDEVPDPFQWSLRMMALVPIGFPEDFLNLPSQLLCGFGAQRIKEIQCYFEHTYNQLPSLWKSENNILLLLIWSPTYHGQTLEVLSDWIKRKESMKLYQRMIEDLRLKQTPELFALTLAALLCRERLLLYNEDDTVHAVGGSYLADFDAILKGQKISNRRAVFEQMILLLVRVLNTPDHFDTSIEIVRLLAQFLEGEATILGPMED